MSDAEEILDDDSICLFADDVSRSSACSEDLLLPLRDYDGLESDQNREETSSRSRASGQDLSSLLTRTRLKARIESIVDSVSQQLKHSSPLLFAISNVHMEYPGPMSSGRPSHGGSLQFRFPGETPDESRRFTVVLEMLRIVGKALNDRATLTKRDVYYHDPALFGSQAIVDRYADGLARSFGVQRSDLGLTAVAKGLATGAARLHFCDGTVIDLHRSNEGFLITSLDELSTIDVSLCDRILVIEKEATYHSVLASPFWLLAQHFSILLTAKGYPDLHSRRLLHRLSQPTAINGFKKLPVEIVTDFDPDGLAIFHTYLHGSAALAHEDEATCPHAVHLGLKSTHLKAILQNGMAMQLTKRDRRRATAMLRRIRGEEMGELQLMLVLNVKAELQSLDEVALVQVLSGALS